MATRSSHKHQGLAKKLLNRAIEFAKQCGYSRVYTRSHDGKDFCLKFGFEVIGDRVGDSLLILKI